MIQRAEGYSPQETEALSGKPTSLLRDYNKGETIFRVTVRRRRSDKVRLRFGRERGNPVLLPGKREGITGVLPCKSEGITGAMPWEVSTGRHKAALRQGLEKE